MSANPRFEGIVPAAVTPLKAEGSLNADVLERLLRAFYAAGCSGVYLCGQTGEGLALSNEIRRKVVEVGVACSPKGKAVIAHIGAGTTHEAVDLARHASKAGVAAVSSLPPGNAYSFEETREYYRAIASVCDVPLLVYYFPEVSKSVATLEQILELCDIPGVAGLKFTSFDLYRLSLIRRAGHVIFNGRDEVLAAGLLMGASGGIGSFYNLVPGWFCQLYSCAQQGRWAEAKSIQDRINDLIRTVLRYPMLPAVKHLLRCSGFDSGQAVAPRRPLQEHEADTLEAEVRKLGIEPRSYDLNWDPDQQAT